MTGLLDLLNGPEGRKVINGVASETGAPQDKTADVLSMAMPLLLGAMKKNVNSSSGAQGLLSALNSKHTGGILDDLGGLFGGGVDQSVKKDGAGILGHVFGSKQQNVEMALSQKSGLESGTISEILKIAAPIVMGYLGRQKQQRNINDASGMNSLLGGLLGGQPAKNQSLITALLDADGDGSILDDVAGMVMNSGKKKRGIGGLLGGLFGK